MTKKKSKPAGLMVQAKVIEVYRHDEGMGVVLNDGKRQQSFVIQFDVTDENLDVGDIVTVTIIRSEV